MADWPEEQVERYVQGSLSPAEARALAQSALDQPELFEDLTFRAVAKAGLAGQGDEALTLYVSGKLPPEAQRELAQAALENEELFDALAAHGAVERSLGDPAVRSALSDLSVPSVKVAVFPRRSRAIAIVGSIAAAVALLAVYVVRSGSVSKDAANGNPPASHRPALTPGLDPTTGEPVLLARELAPRRDGSSPVFRSAAPDSRAPRASGSIVSLDNLLATVDLGSLDGLAKDVELQVFRGASTQPIGRLIVETVFRERARARIASGQGLREQDQVRSGASVYLGAVEQQIDALADQSDVAKARAVAREALAWADANSVAAGAKRNILERLGALDYQARDTAAAEQHYRSAIAAFDSPPAASASERSSTLNSLGVVYLLAGDLAQAESSFTEARGGNPAAVSDVQSLNNLGVVAELRGDTRKAETLYSDAMRALQNASGKSAQDRQAVEANIARLAKRGGAQH